MSQGAARQAQQPAPWTGATRICNKAVAYVEYIREWSSGESGDVPWVAGSVDFVEGVNQGVLMLGFERNVEIDRGSSGGVA